MKRVTILMVLVLLLGAPAWGMEHYTRPLQDNYGRAIAGATVTVYLAGTSTAATIYSDNGVTAKVNPFTTNLTGVVDFYAANGAYDLVFSKVGVVFTAADTRRITLFDYADLAVTSLPVNPFVGQPVVVTDDAAAGDCASLGGTALSNCAWDGSAWVSIGGGGGGTVYAIADTTEPATCTPGGTNMFFFDTNTLLLYHCTETNTYELVAPAESQGLTDVITNNRIHGLAISPESSVKIGSDAAGEYVGVYRDSARGPRVTCIDENDVPDQCDKTTLVEDGFSYGVTDKDGNFMVQFAPNAGTSNAKYALGDLKAKVAFSAPLEPRGAATSALESIITNQPKDYFLTLTDANTDAADFTFDVTPRMAGATTMTFRLIGVSKNASPSGNIDLDCAVSTYTPGTDTFAAHVTTGEVTALLTPAVQNRPVAVTTASHTINGGALVAGDVVFGSCEVDATATTSAQMSDFRLRGWVLVTLDVNSLSD